MRLWCMVTNEHEARKEAKTLMSYHDAEMERRQSRLADLLVGRQLREGETPDAERIKAWRTARVMLCATELLDACELSWSILRQLSTDEFAKGGDRIARDQLYKAISLATDGVFDSQRFQSSAREAIHEGIRLNALSTL